MQVTAAIIRDEQGQILICQRPAHKHHGSLWEFPGGKLEPGEDLEKCLVRECQEELGIVIVVDRLYAKWFHKSEPGITLFFYECRQISGAMQLIAHQQVLWVAPAKMVLYAFCPADKEIVQMLQSPE